MSQTYLSEFLLDPTSWLLPRFGLKAHSQANLSTCQHGNHISERWCETAWSYLSQGKKFDQYTCLVVSEKTDNEKKEKRKKKNLQNVSVLTEYLFCQNSEKNQWRSNYREFFSFDRKQRRKSRTIKFHGQYHLWNSKTDSVCYDKDYSRKRYKFCEGALLGRPSHCTLLYFREGINYHATLWRIHQGWRRVLFIVKPFSTLF